MKKHFVIPFCLLSILLSSCASTIKVDFTHPAEMNLIGSSVSVLPFSTSSGSSSERSCFEALNSRLKKEIVQSGYLTLIETDSRYFDSTQKIVPDYSITWEGSRFDVNDYTRTSEWKDSKGNYHRDYTYVREVTFDFHCKIVDNKSHAVIGYKDFSYKPRDTSSESSSELDSSYDICNGSITKAVNEVVKVIQPYTERKKLKLLSNSNSAMKTANTMVKSGLIYEGGSEYYKTYQQENIFEAGYNAALLLEALGKYDSSESLMEEVAARSKDKKAFKALFDIRKEKELNQQFQNQVNPQEKNELKEGINPFDDTEPEFLFEAVDSEDDENGLELPKNTKSLKKNIYTKSACNELLLSARLNDFDNNFKDVSFAIQYLPVVLYNNHYSFKFGGGLNFKDDDDLSLFIKNGLGFSVVSFDIGTFVILRNFNFDFNQFTFDKNIINKLAFEASAELDFHLTEFLGINLTYIPAEFSFANNTFNADFKHSISTGIALTGRYF
ncbi:MAG: hypothetical protein K6A43_08555 [Treponema sp.]|nr:hypothetical protein [Treponema sp.]